MFMSWGHVLFAVAPVLLGGLLLWRYPRSRRVRLRSLVVYVAVMSLLIWGALQVVAYIAAARVPPAEVFIVLWFAIGWRLAWELWQRTVGRWGQRWVRWARTQRRQGRPAPILPRLIPLGRAALTASILFPLFLSTVITHRCKLADGQDPLSTFNMPFERMFIPTGDGLTLDAWFIPEAGAERTIVICHGAGANKGNFIWFLGPLAHQGYNVVFFDFRAHGGSDGRRATYGIRERLDVVAVVDWLKRERPEESQVIVGLGSSQGAMALALAAAEEPRIDAVVLDSPFTSPRDLVHARAGRLPLIGPVAADWMLLLVSGVTATDFFTPSAERAVASLGQRPVMVIHGEEDPIMPATHAQRLHDASAGPRAVWFGPGPHSNIITTDPSGYAQRVMAFLGEHLGSPLPPRWRPM